MEILEGAEEYIKAKGKDLGLPKIKIGKYGGKTPKDLFL
jgi:hypothetical protein